MPRSVGPKLHPPVADSRADEAPDVPRGVSPKLHPPVADSRADGKQLSRNPEMHVLRTCELAPSALRFKLSGPPERIKTTKHGGQFVIRQNEKPDLTSKLGSNETVTLETESKVTVSFDQILLETHTFPTLQGPRGRVILSG